MPALADPPPAGPGPAVQDPAAAASEQDAVRRQYDTVIADRYDDDPQGVIRAALARGLGQLEGEELLSAALPPLRALDLGMGTGLFLQTLIDAAGREVVPHGVDLSAGMVAKAQARVPGLKAEVDDAANVLEHFPGTSFDLVCTHFVTGFVPIAHLAPRIARRLEPGGAWSFIGGLSAGYPELQKKAGHPLVRTLAGGRTPNLGGLLTPADTPAVQSVMREHGLEVVAAETFTPRLEFADFDQFMTFAYHGGWLTPFLESMGVQDFGRFARWALNRAVFPVHDTHSIAVVLARKPRG